MCCRDSTVMHVIYLLLFTRVFCADSKEYKRLLEELQAELASMRQVLTKQIRNSSFCSVALNEVEKWEEKTPSVNASGDSFFFLFDL